MVEEKRPMDRRIQKTRSLLHEALFSLIHEKNYDAVGVREILDRANVGRSTFYTHFSDKDDLLVSGMRDMLLSFQPADMPSSTSGPERIIWFSLPIFEHVHRRWRAGGAPVGSRAQAIIHEHLQKVLAELIANEVTKLLKGRRKNAARVPSDLIIHHVASTFILVLNWWVENKNPRQPLEVNHLFRALILPSLAANLA